jgi:endonuclease-3 related protein
MSVSSSGKIEIIIRSLKEKYGTLEWWRGTTDEVMIGAILTQQTRWENVERSLENLRQQGLCSIAAINNAECHPIEKAIMCSGFYRIKARRLKFLSAHVTGEYGSIERMAQQPADRLRENLLGVHGIGEETADSILCYGFSHQTFVIDAYTERICRCAGIAAKRPALKKLFETVLPRDTAVYQQAHAHIVEYAKEYCVKKRCNKCTIPTLNG